MNAGATHFVVVSALLFGIGLGGVLARRDAIGQLIGVQLMLAAGGLALIGFARTGYDGDRPLAGMSFALLVMLVGVAEAALGGGLYILAKRRGADESVDELDAAAPSEPPR